MNTLLATFDTDIQYISNAVVTTATRRDCDSTSARLPCDEWETHENRTEVAEIAVASQF